MMRRAVPILLSLGILAAFGGTLVLLYTRSKPPPVSYATVTPKTMDIVKKTVAPGAIVPRREVIILPRVSGIVEKLFVEPGDYVKKKALIARIQIIPDVVSLNNAEANLKLARINFDNAKAELERFRAMFAQGVITQTELNRYQVAFDLRQQELEAAESNLQLVRDGASKKSGKVSNLVYSTVEGMVLEVPVEEGSSVIEANTFNQGTAIATVADMQDLVFEGRVDESEVGKLEVGMPVTITVGALEQQTFDGKLEYIAPKGVEKDGTIEFEVRAAVELKQGIFMRANYSANADIILDRREHVLALDESVLRFEEGKAFVDVEVGPQQFETRPVSLGLSDGLHIEVLSGIDKDARIKHKQN